MQEDAIENVAHMLASRGKVSAQPAVRTRPVVLGLTCRKRGPGLCQHRVFNLPMLCWAVDTLAVT